MKRGLVSLQTRPLSKVHLSIQVLVFSILAFLVLPVAGSRADHIEDPDTLKVRLMQVVGLYHRAPEAQKSQMLAQMTELAQKRKALMLEMLERDVDGFLHHSMLGPEREQFPEPIREILEREIEIEGELSVLRADDFERGLSTLVHLLAAEGKPSRTFQLHFAGNPPDLPTGSKIRARGIALDSELALASEGGSSVTTLSTAAAVTAVSGERTAAILIGNFLNSPVTSTPADIQKLMFSGSSSVNQMYQEASFGQIGFSGDLFGPYSLNYYYDSKDIAGWANALDAAAAAAGVNLAGYAHRVYVVPNNATGYAGVGTIGGSPCKAWVFTPNFPDVYAHELGHNVGMHHASTLTSEYGDYSDVMGIGGIGLRAFNAPHKVQMGWVPAARVQTVTADGTYTISPLAVTDGSSLQVLKIHKPDTNEDYYLGYRWPAGSDTGLEPKYGGSQVQLHRWLGSSNKTFYLSGLGDGGSFNDPMNGINVTQISHSPSSAAVLVSYGAPVCIKVPPAVAVSPPVRGGAAGTNLIYTVTVTNQDTSVCPGSTFTLSAVAPEGWTATLSSAGPLTLAPKAVSAAVTCTVGIPGGASPGNYTVQITAMDTGDNAHAATAQAVSVVDTVAPTVNITSPASGSSFTVGRAFDLSATASDNAGVVKVEFYRNGTLWRTDLTEPFIMTWYTTGAAGGSYTIVAKAYDAAGNVGISAPVTVTLLQGDTTAPAVSITFPQSGGTVGGIYDIATSVSDDVAVTRVDFYVDDVLKGTDLTSPYGFGWETGPYANGPHSLFAKAYDAAGNVGSSAPVNVTVGNLPDNLPPTVSILSPAEGSVLAGPISVKISVSDDVTVCKSELYVDGILTATSLKYPSFYWDPKTVSEGPHVLTAKAYDAVGNVGASAPVNVTVVKDTTPPTVGITSPSDGSTMSGIVSVEASAMDNLQVKSVSFYIDGAMKAAATSSPYTYSWNTTTAANGSHTLQAKAYDTAGNQGVSPVIGVTVSNIVDTTPPTVSITSPGDRATIGGTVSVAASAADNVGVAKVELYVDGALKGNDTTSPYTFSLDTKPLSEATGHWLQGKATDPAGNAGLSPIIVVTVINTLPAITSQPVSQAVKAGQTATFAVTAVGPAPLSYQWQKNNADIAGATASSYTTPPTVSADNKSTYQCRVSNPAGSVTSGSATLSVRGKK